MMDITPNPFPEPEASLETYKSYIYGSVVVNNAVQPKEGNVSSAGNGTPKITVLTARKKRTK